MVDTAVSRATITPSIYETIGVRTVINAAGAATITGGSLMSPETAAAMVEASRAFVMVEELNARVGEKIAEVTGAEAGYVTCGSFAAMTLAAARFGVFGTAEANQGEPRQIAALGGAKAWLNSPPLSPASLLGKVVLVQFGTYTCINWLRTLPYMRAWIQNYGQQLQQKMKQLVEKALPGRPVDVRPAPERVCPKAGCDAMSINVLFTRQNNSCVAVALINGVQLSGVPAWLAWLGVHLIFLLGFRNKVSVLIQWTYSYFTYKRGARIITGTSGERAAGSA